MKWDSSYSSTQIATDEEMGEFLANMNFQIKVETRQVTEDKQARTVHNIVLYFTPFEGKYLNYVKRYWPHKYSTVDIRTDVGMWPSPKKVGYGGRAIYLGISMRKLNNSKVKFSNLKHADIFTRHYTKDFKSVGTRKGEEDGVIQKDYYFHGKCSYIGDLYIRKQDYWRWRFPIKMSSRNVTRWRDVEINENETLADYYYCVTPTVKRAAIKALGPVEAKRGYMVFFEDEVDMKHLKWNPSKTFKHSDGTISYVVGDGYAGYVTHMGLQKYVSYNVRYTSNCLRGQSLHEHDFK